MYMPTLRFTATTIPKWIGLMPRAMTTGRNTGVRTRIAAGGSRKLPTKSSTRLKITSVP